MEQERKSVLVIDDQEDERAIQRAMLDHFGYAVREAADGEAGVRMAVEEPPHLVLLDVAMPRLDGFEVCRMLRSDSRTADVPVLIFTASVVGDVEQQARAAGADGILTKPVDPHKVVEEISRILDSRNA